jgi:diaminohydroxyphosphoribosylaminopyrimidine deaminase/5-amino-6-(5-phosphoribosylamino)uracil reductase
MDASGRGESAIGATAYVTLEPCCHFGRTPPCTDALLKAGIKRAVVGIRDRNPRVAGGGIAILRAGGVEVAEGILENACLCLHAPFFKSIRTGLPWVMLKLALGSDNGIGPAGARTNITGAQTQNLAHALRRACDGILVGRNTVEIDDPQLTDRWPFPVPPHRTFRRIVLDSRGKLGQGFRVCQKEAGHSTLRAITVKAEPIDGAEDLRLPPGPGGCSLQHMLHELTLRGVTRLLAEGGPRVAMQLLNADLVDVVHIFRSAEPAGGSIVSLNMEKFGSAPRLVDFDGGKWEIWNKPIIVA